MNEPAIKASEVGKKFILGSIGSSTLREQLSNHFNKFLGSSSQEEKDFWALRNVSFELKKGEVLGIIGKNGSGKSTLLKILSKITAPTEGLIEIDGHLSSLLEVGTGFHPELTGRENVFLNGSILGMKKKEISEKFDQIVEFAGISKFMDTPVKRYSSGMYVRLAFAVAAHLQPEILIVDEVLAVGDQEFQQKCLGKMNQVASEGRTVIFVSHNMGAVAELCSRVILLDSGSITFDGPTKEGIELYLNKNSKNSIIQSSNNQIESIPNVIQSIQLLGSSGESKVDFGIDEEIKFKVCYNLEEVSNDSRISVVIFAKELPLFTCFSSDHGIKLNKGQNQHITFCIPKMLLKEGDYHAEFYVSPPVFKFGSPVTFSVNSHYLNTEHKAYRSDRLGLIISPAKWHPITNED